MQYDKQSTGSSGIVIGLAVLLAFVVLGGVMIAGVGGWFFFRTGTLRRQVMVEQQQATEAARQAELQARMAAENAAHAPQTRSETAVPDNADVEDMAAQNRITIEVDKQGSCSVDGESVDSKELMSKLHSADGDRDTKIVVVIRVAKDCPLNRAEEVIASCWKSGLKEISIRPLGTPSAP